MQVSVEVTQGVGREMTVGVPKETVNEEIQTRLKSLSRTAKLNGFRPGKVPLRVLEKRFGKQVRGEVVSELVQSTFSEAISQSDVKIASEPVFQDISDSPQEDLQYKVAFAVLPEIDSVSVENMAIDQWQADINDGDIDGVVDKLREQGKNWEPVERAAQEGDQVTVDYTATVEGEESDNAREDVPVVLGSSNFLDGFDDGLVGAAKGDAVDLNLQLPSNPQDESDDGKPIHFSITVKEVSEPVLPEIDETFIKNFGVEDGTMESFRGAVRDNMGRELEQALRTRNRQQLFDKLIDSNPIEIPDPLLQAAAHREKQNTAVEWQNQGMDPSILDQLDSNLFRNKAQREMHLGLLVTCIASSNEFEASEAEIREKVMEMASTYEEPEAVANWILSEEGQTEQFRMQVIEDKVNEWLLEQADIEVNDINFDEAIEWARTRGASDASEDESDAEEAEAGVPEEQTESVEADEASETADSDTTADAESSSDGEASDKENTP